MSDLRSGALVGPCGHQQLYARGFGGRKVEVKGIHLVERVLVFDVVVLVVGEEDEHIPVVILFDNHFRWEERSLVEVVDERVECHYTFFVVEDVVH
jgi:F420-0:gamma-glutamyl ligase